jgi:hypothetical protein
MADAKTTVTMKADKKGYAIQRNEPAEEGTVVTILGSATRNSAKPRFFDFKPNAEGKKLGLTQQTFERMKDSPAGEGLLTTVLKNLSGEAAKAAQTELKPVEKGKTAAA